MSDVGWFVLGWARAKVTDLEKIAAFWTGAEWATRLKSETLCRVIAVLLVIIAAVLLFTHDTEAGAPALVAPTAILFPAPKARASPAARS